MMSLVDYQSSSDEESDGGEVKLDKQTAESIPEPPKQILKRKEPVKITVPAITEDEEAEEISSKKCKVNSSSGLLGMLPAPKYSSGKTKLMPYVLTKKKEFTSQNKVAKPISRAVITTTTIGSHPTEETKGMPNENDSVSSLETGNEHSNTNYFFSSENTDEDDKGLFYHHESILLKSLPPPIPVTPISSESPVNVVKYTNSELSVPSNFADESYPETLDVDNSYQVTDDPSPYENQNFGSAEDEDIMNNEEFKRFQGRNRGKEEINIIDVNVDQELPDKTQWHTKSLTEEKVSHSRNRKGMPTQQQRRKHQITYLAFQAKEREVDLKNQWSQNRLTKRETQAKYGF